MKKLLMLAICCLFVNVAYAQQTTPSFDAALADSLGADDYGMKWYVMAILKIGDAQINDAATRDSLFAGHFATINRLSVEGFLTVAGPMAANDRNYRGIFILNVRTIEEAIELMQTDPTVNAKIFDVEYYRWYGSAALPVYLETHQKIQKVKM